MGNRIDESAALLEGCLDVLTSILDRTINDGDDASALRAWLERSLEHENDVRRHEPGSHTEFVQKGRKMAATHAITQLRTITEC